MAHFNCGIPPCFVLGPRTRERDSLATVSNPAETIKHMEVIVLESIDVPNDENHCRPINDRPFNSQNVMENPT